jgi:AraC-like DNA-binding protein
MGAQPLRVRRNESELGRWELVEGDPAPALRPYLSRPYQGFVEHRPGPMRRLEVPHGGIVLVVNLGEPFRISGPRDPLGEEHRGTFLAGLADEYAITEYVGSSQGIQVDLTPPGAHVLLGLPMSELANRVVQLEDVLGPTARLLTEALYEAPGWRARFELLDVALGARLAAARPPSPDVAWAWRRLVDTGGGVEIGALTSQLGCSRRHLIARFREQVGLPPKALARVMRFNRVVALLGRDDGGRLAEIAYACGYYDQSHLNRDFRDLAGITPGEFLARRIPDDLGVSAD